MSKENKIFPNSASLDYSSPGKVLHNAAKTISDCRKHLVCGLWICFWRIVFFQIFLPVPVPVTLALTPCSGRIRFVLPSLRPSPQVLLALIYLDLCEFIGFFENY
jgi:hypothetical protein